MNDDMFLIFINRILSSEGGYVNNPNDPGGETKWGIAKASYPDVNIRALTREQAIEIYRRDFWLPWQGWLPDAIAFQALDAAVNHGHGNATRWLQRALGVADDGHVGPVTKAAIGKFDLDVNDVLMKFNAERLEFYTRLSTWPTFGKGWARRIANNLRYGAEDN